MLAYASTKAGFLSDAPNIAELVRGAVHEHLGIAIRQRSSEYQSWQNSLGNAMFHVLNASSIPDDAGVAIEYRLHGRRQRIDVVVTGYGPDDLRKAIVVELKQWSEVAPSLLPDHVLTFLGGYERDVPHPSYQAWSYARLLEDFYEVVSADPIAISACAFLHNCADDAVLRSAPYEALTSRAPVFVSQEHIHLARFLSEQIVVGDGGTVLRRIDASNIAPSKQLVTALSSMLEGNEEFVLIDEQKTAFEKIMAVARRTRVGERWVLIVEGGPGTGKSVIAINALVQLLAEGLNVRYVTKNAAPRAVYRQKLQRGSRQVDVTNLFVSSDAFYRVEEDAYDVLLVDEAHRLVRNSGLYGNLGENQIAEIIRAARVSVFFIDERQKVTWRDYGSIDEIEQLAFQHEAPVERLELTAQFRCAGSDDYLRWVDALLTPGSDLEGVDLSDAAYDVRVVDSPTELRDLILAKNQEGGTSRLLAGYCWDWVSKRDPSKTDIVLANGDFAQRWNLTRDGSGWLVAPNSVHEVGCVHTSQGLEGDYFGVIIGMDLVARNGLLESDPTARARTDQSLRGWKSAAKTDRDEALGRADEIIRNTYRTLLTRGAKGTFIFCVDEAMQSHVKESLAKAGSPTAAAPSLLPDERDVRRNAPISGS